MDRMARKLQDLLAKYPNNATVQDAYSRSQSWLSHQSVPQDPHITWDVTRKFFFKLQDEGILEKSTEIDSILEQVHAELLSTGTVSAEQQAASSHPSLSSSSQSEEATASSTKLSIVLPPSISAGLRPLSTPTWLPAELLEVLNQAYFLHVLAMDPQKVLPPGKSLLSVMSNPSVLNADSDTPSLQSRVEDLVHKAFWDEAREALSSPTPAVQLSRLKRLYEDLHIVLVPLLPPGHPVLITLSSPLSPTSSPLRSAVTHLREILNSLKERCAPFRDPEIHALLQKIEDPPTAQLPGIVVDSVRETIKFAEAMKEDLSQFVLGNMGETQLQGVIHTLAQEREKDLVSKLWGPSMIPDLWVQWLNTFDRSSPLSQLSTPPEQKWILRLIQALGLNAPVSCRILHPHPQSESETTSPPDPLSNQLPPPFFFVAPTLLSIQNYLQALIIAATLRSLVRLPPHLPSQSPTPADDFMSRIWTLLSDEIDKQSGDTKLINLADEIIRVRGLVGDAIEADEESRLRAAVDRTLQPTDPVFQLLQRRLLRAFAERLIVPPAADSQHSSQPPPVHLQSGRGPRTSASGKKPVRIGLPGIEARPPPRQPELSLSIKGFDDTVLTVAVTREVERLRACIDWIRMVWPGVISKV
ncbi:hypothetical protein BXZ70DRAFT_1072755 [Cristinia sonorae]|uniref:Uncharacterized protein n=1 Tax=Cristinia sonorae TaxID=1940300 RepID=A0A8K0UJ22_9AGAR|nr:hypothetical protein BXZ70DRAFT_1072755 [Cristinia sonorae]